MQQEKATILEHKALGGDYRHLVFRAPTIAPQVRPGQFVHVRLTDPADAILRRPFSVYRTSPDGRLEIIYKVVGRGTAAMRNLAAGMELDLIGPLGRGFPAGAVGKFPVIVAGGYGMAALYLFARESATKGIAFFGGAGAGDILCVPEFEALGWTVRVATEDGSIGERGLVTAPLDAWLERDLAGRAPEFFACGPNGMLRAVGERAGRGNWTAWISMDRNMGCGVGACLTCVQKVRDPDAPAGWKWARVCREGPVFESREIQWE